jgi:hypothetical protein
VTGLAVCTRNDRAGDKVRVLHSLQQTLAMDRKEQESRRSPRIRHAAVAILTETATLHVREASQRCIIDADLFLRSYHRIDVSSAAGVSETYPASIFRVNLEALTSETSSTLPTDHRGVSGIRTWLIMSHSRCTEARFAQSLFCLPQVIITPPSFRTHLLLPSEVCDSPEQAAHYHIRSWGRHLRPKTWLAYRAREFVFVYFCASYCHVYV